MFNREIIEYPSRAKAVEALLRFRENPAVVAIELIGDLSSTLRVTMDDSEFVNDADPEDLLGVPVPTPTPEPNIAEPGSEAPAAPEGTPAPDGDGSDAEGSEEGDEDEDTVPDVTDADRATLRSVVKEWGLEVEIPDNGPLAPIREKVAAALAVLSDDE